MAGIPAWEIFARISGHLGSWLLFRAPSGATSCVRDDDCASGMTCVASTCVEQVIRSAATFKIAGKVLAKGSNAPVDGATVTISGFETTPVAVNRKTGGYVSFALPCGEGLMQLTVAADGFRQEQKVVPRGADQEVKTVDFALASSTELLTAELRGTLKNAANGQPIPGIVFVPALDLEIPTDEGGHFHAVLKAGRYQVLISSPRYLTQKKDVQLHGGDVVIFDADMTARPK